MLHKKKIQVKINHGSIVREFYILFIECKEIG